MANNETDDRARTSVFVGNEMLVVQCAADAGRHGLEARAVVSSNPLVLDEAARLGLRTADARGRALSECVAGIEFEVLFSIGYQQIISSEVLELAEVAVNFHDGVLPAYGGLNVTTWSLLNGEPEHGITWHLMSVLADRGNILHEVRFDVRDDETAFSLNARCYEAGLESFGTVARMVASGDVDGHRQIEEGRRMYRRAERPVVFLDPNVPARELARAVRSLDVGPRAVGSPGAVRWLTPDGHLLIGGAGVVDGGTGRVGEVRIEDGRPVIQTSDGSLSITDLRTPSGDPVDSDGLEQIGIVVGTIVGAPDPAVVAGLERLDEELARSEPAWQRRLSGGEPVASALFDGAGDEWTSSPVRTAAEVPRDRALLAVASWVDGVCEAGSSLIGVTDPSSRERLATLGVLRAPLFEITRNGAESSLAASAETLDRRLAEVLADGPYLADLVGRDPDLRGRSLASPIRLDLDVAESEDPAPRDDASSLTVEHGATGALVVHSRLGIAETERLAERLAAVVDALDRGIDRAADLPLTSAADADFMSEVNATERDVDPDVTLDSQFWQRVELAGDAPAVSADGVTISYRELGGEVERVASLLVAAGVVPGDTVGIGLDRSTAMVVSVLATLSVGAHYLPLDPGYPAERLEYMVADSGAVIVIASGTLPFDPGSARVLDPAASVAGAPETSSAAHGPDALAYVIYTSGSTGRPKGVELEHRQVVNFFAAMDDVIDADERSVWLAATSLSFDISVLELLWTLTRGLHLVVQRESGYGEGTQAAAAAQQPMRSGPGTMSLFYFAADVAQAATGYRLLMESAKWADERGFEAVWTPERHFHDFGAPYPNPSVVGGALAVATERIGIRAGSVVLPLHSPVRVAEEWAVVDNLSGGRVGLSFASGWQPNDFVLRPEAYATARESLPELVDAVQRLWRGESVELPGHDGEPVAVSTLPRPVQAELPTWITSAGSPSSFERAGRLGANILTHLLGQSIEQLSDNIDRYRNAWDEAGHPGQGRVTLMLHTFLDEDGDLARETARLPLKGYLGTAVGLLKDFASAFPTFHKAGADADEAFRSLTDDEMSQLLDMATERYLTTSGLFGTVADATSMADSVLAIGVDEIACLIDFGIDDDTVLGSLDLLQQVHEQVTSSPADGAGATHESFADLVERYGVTHFQCTPSLASMLLASPSDRAALSRVQHLLVGGEALPLGLATELRELLPGRLTNMYGPTETTIWSLVHEIDEAPEVSVPIGRPIANTQIEIMDAEHRVLPTGVYGELHIGGAGVARGYRGRPDLNAERFREFGDRGRFYATGDVARVRRDGVVEFGGRADHQVKIRGHRIELAEIESVLDRHPAVVRSVVVAGGDGATLLAFVVLRHDAAGDADAEPTALRAFVGEHLPGVMVPSAIGVLDELPLTPNGKVDRQRLPSTVAAQAPSSAGASPAGSTGELVTSIWSEHLGMVPGPDENFFDVGGHSLLAVKIFRVLGESFDGVALTDLFRFPTVRTLAAHLDALQQRAESGGPSADTTEGPESGTDRGARRRRARRRS